MYFNATPLSWHNDLSLASINCNSFALEAPSNINFDSSIWGSSAARAFKSPAVVFVNFMSTLTIDQPCIWKLYSSGYGPFSCMLFIRNWICFKGEDLSKYKNICCIFMMYEGCMSSIWDLGERGLYQNKKKIQYLSNLKGNSFIAYTYSYLICQTGLPNLCPKSNTPRSSLFNKEDLQAPETWDIFHRDTG